MPLDVPCMPDPALGLLITFAIGQISLSLVFVLGRPCQDLLRAASFDGCFITEDAEQQRRKHQSRVEAFSKFLPWWILANDATVLLFIAIDVGTYFDGSQGLGFGPLGSGSFVSFAQMSYGLVVLAFGLVLRFVFTFGTEESTVRDTVLIFVSVTVTMCLAPPYLQPVAMLTAFSAAGDCAWTCLVLANASGFSSCECRNVLAEGIHQCSFDRFHAHPCCRISRLAFYCHGSL